MLYSREAGAGSQHGWQELTTLVGAISYLVVHVFKVISPSHNLLSLIHSTQAKTRAKTFMHILSSQFLCRIQESPTLDGYGNVILSEMTGPDFESWPVTPIAGSWKRQ